MQQRFVTIWFRHLKTDWFVIRKPSLRGVPFVLAAPDHGRMVITAANTEATAAGAIPGSVVADARAITPSLQVLDDKPGLAEKLLKALAEWCIRYSPIVGIDPPGGLIINASGCTHLWGGEEEYLSAIANRLNEFGYQVRLAIAGTIGAAWGVSRFGQSARVIESGQQTGALLPLPPAALRLEPEILDRFYKLGLYQVKDFIKMPRSVLRRRFGAAFIQRLNQALGLADEFIEPVIPVEAYQERLPCMEPIVTATGIGIALQRLLDAICNRLRREEKGLRTARFKCYRVDGKISRVEIGTNRASHNSAHLFKLFENRLGEIEPGLGIELFVLEAQKVEDAPPVQKRLWESSYGLEDSGLAELLDRIAGKMGPDKIHRYLPAEHHWPERCFSPALSLNEKPITEWKSVRKRPLHLLPRPGKIEVSAPLPDYPPMLFRYNGAVHKIIRSDGPERIETEWWLESGEHRDYYCVEDEQGRRYWLFRLGHYDTGKSHQWFLHGFFA